MTKLDVRVLSPEGALASTEATKSKLASSLWVCGSQTNPPMIAQISVGTLEIKDSDETIDLLCLGWILNCSMIMLLC